MAPTKHYNPDRDVPAWKGGTRPYDLAKEVTLAFVVVAILTVGLAVLFGSPDDKAVTIRSWSNADQVGFAQTAITELDGTSASATYGPPYNNTPDVAQKIGPISLQQAAGIHIPVHPAQDFVLTPLSTAKGNPQQARWTAAYEKAAAKARVVDGKLNVPLGAYGPVGVMIANLTQMASSGALDAAMINGAGFYSTDYTKSLLFVADGTYYEDQAAKQHLLGEQWGMMNETGSYPGQPWLWLYTLWYQIPPFNGDNVWGANADAIVWVLMMGLTLVLMLLPFIPGLRSIPRWTRVYKLIWRDHYRSQA